MRQGTYQAREYKPPCPQPTGRVDVKDVMDEDCLYLNVFTPRVNTPNTQVRRPVVIFIEGKF